MFTYDTSLQTEKDKIRSLIGDTVSLGHRFEDEEIEMNIAFLPSTAGRAHRVAANLITQSVAALAVRSGGIRKKTIGRTSIETGQDQGTASVIAGRVSGLIRTADFLDNISPLIRRNSRSCRSGQFP